MTSVHFLLAHEPSTKRKKPGHITERKGEYTKSPYDRDLIPTRVALLAGLIRPPTIRQFIHEDQLYTEEEERSLTQFEVRMLSTYVVSSVLTVFPQLFADLVFVAIVHVS
jgi:hypothetical protein